MVASIRSKPRIGQLNSKFALGHYPPNPDYGSGVFRRRIRILTGKREIVTTVNDDYHSMWCRIGHDGARVIKTEGALIRYPKSTCASASNALAELEGMALGQERNSPYGEGRPGRSCTHLLDLAVLALVHARSQPGEIVIDIAIDDEADGVQPARASIDGALIHRWAIEQGKIASPDIYAGQPIFSGFSRWAQTNFSGPSLDAALMLQKGLFVARGRRHIVDRKKVFVRDEPNRLGVCFSYSEPQFQHAYGLTGYVRNLTDGIVEDLPALDGNLRFKTCEWSVA